MPPFYLQERFADASVGAKETEQIERLHYIGSHLNLDGATDQDGQTVLSDGKLYVTSTQQSLN